MKKVSPFLFENLGSQQGAGKLAARLAWGCFWTFYVFLVLFGLLMGAFLSGSMLMAGVVEEPLRMTEDLNFDYTKPSPDALVPVGSCNGGLCSGGKAGAWEHRGWRLVPPNHKLQSTTSLTLPESDYNRKLGMFQIKAYQWFSKQDIVCELLMPPYGCKRGEQVFFKHRLPILWLSEIINYLQVPWGSNDGTQVYQASTCFERTSGLSGTLL